MIATAAGLVVVGAVLVLVGTAQDGIAWELGAVAASIVSLAALGFGVARARRHAPSTVGGSHPPPREVPGDGATS